MEWQPIETAPKTTRARLVYCPRNKCIYCVSYNGRGRWGYFGGDGILNEEPTHWMPLPQPPTE